MQRTTVATTLLLLFRSLAYHLARTQFQLNDSDDVEKEPTPPPEGGEGEPDKPIRNIPDSTTKEPTPPPEGGDGEVDKPIPNIPED